MLRAEKEADFTSGGNQDAALAFHTMLNGTLAEKMRITSGGDLRVAQVCDEAGSNCKDVSTGWGGGGASAINDLSDGVKNATNLFLGHEGGAFGANNTRNTAVGIEALDSLDNTPVTLVEGVGNTAVGHQALTANTSGGVNTAVGDGALSKNTTGHSNTAIGHGTLVDNTTGNGNSALGQGALSKNTTGINNTAIGISALLFNTSGRDNVAVGVSALQNNTTTSELSALGTGALLANTSGTANTPSPNAKKKDDPKASGGAAGFFSRLFGSSKK
jgi:hypothetical protein